MKFASPSQLEGDYSLLLVVDPGNQLGEQYKTNNSAVSSSTVHILPAYVDLQAALVGRLPASVTPGKKVPISVLVTNNGTVTASGGATTIRLYAVDAQTASDSDAEVSPSAPLLVTLPKKLSIKSGKSVLVKFNLVAPQGAVEPGYHYLLAKVDFTGPFAEKNPADNQVFSQSEVLFN
jgi:hypothetical protein